MRVLSGRTKIEVCKLVGIRTDELEEGSDGGGFVAGSSVGGLGRGTCAYLTVATGGTALGGFAAVDHDGSCRRGGDASIAESRAEAQRVDDV